MTGRRRALLLAALALAVPLPALALTGGSGGGLAVSASLKGCGVASGSIVCGIDASFSGIAEARYITASVTAPDGSVTDFGTVVRGSSGSTTLWVPYTGNGTYSVSASAWGVDDAGDAEVIETEQADTGSHDRIKQVETSGGGPRSVPEPAGAEGDQTQAEQAPETTPEPQLPPCEPAPPATPPTDPASGDPAAGESGTPAPDSVDQATPQEAPSTDAAQVPGVDCAPPGAAASPAPTP
jgi:hypothetical protein